MSLKKIMIQGTCSSAGKSILTMGLCRIFSNRGYKVTPYKSQNMTRNTIKTEDNLIVAKTQYYQVESARAKHSKHINPILLVPNTDRKSSIILNGKKYLELEGIDYYKKKKELGKVVKESFEKLTSESEVVVIEGAGSPAEINLREDDFVNMGLAQMVDSNVILVGDIERGGVFASIYGTYKILDKKDRDRIKGFIINKFRGDIDILMPGVRELEKRLNIKCLGILPYFNIELEDEDSLVNSGKKKRVLSAKNRDTEYENIAKKIIQYLDFDEVIKIMEIE